MYGWIISAQQERVVKNACLEVTCQPCVVKFTNNCKSQKR